MTIAGAASALCMMRTFTNTRLKHGQTLFAVGRRSSQRNLKPASPIFEATRWKVRLGEKLLPGAHAIERTASDCRSFRSKFRPVLIQKFTPSHDRANW